MKTPGTYISEETVMEHEEAIESHAAEQYVLGEMSDSVRDAYEEHYFSCPVCAEEVTAAFRLAEGLRLEAQAERPVHEKQSLVEFRRPQRSWWFWTPALGYAAAVVLAAGLAYQMGIVVPRINRELAEARQPVALMAVNLTTLGSRAVPDLMVNPPAGQPFSILVSIPPDPPANSYEVSIVTGNGEERLRVPVTAQQAVDTVQILVPPGILTAGRYKLVTEGLSSTGQRAEIGSHEFTVQ
jgi:hypothetical protein